MSNTTKIQGATEMGDRLVITRCHICDRTIKAPAREFEPVCADCAKIFDDPKQFRPARPLVNDEE